MNITASEVADSKITAEVVIPAADVDAAIAQAYKDAAHKYRFEGFRKGRAPRPVIDSLLGKETILATATKALLDEFEPMVVSELDIVPVTAGEVDTEETVKDKSDYSFKISYKLRQEIELSSYDAVEIEMPPAGATEAEIDYQINALVDMFASFNEVEEGHEIKSGDFVTADIENIANAEALAGEDRVISVGAGNVPAAIDEAVVGMKLSETKEIAWTPEVEGAQEASVKLTVKSVRTKVVPELTEEMAKDQFGFDSIEAMRDAMKIEIENDKNSNLPNIKESRCVAKLAERAGEFELDTDYEQTVFSDLGQNFLNQLAAQGVSLDAWLQRAHITSDQFLSDLHAQATDVARESLALDALARELKVEVTAEDVEAEFSAAGVADVEAAIADFTKSGRIPAVRDSIKRSKAVNWLVENAKVTEVDEFANRA